ncbi:MAG: hydroxymethylbilane synthase [Planctomycetota bacterium]
MFVVGTRGSDLALTQSKATAELIRARTGEDFRLEIIRTRGDAILDKPLPEIGGKGLFTAELEEALREGRIDIAIHSLKDLPVEDPDGLCVGAVPPRADSGDVLVYDPQHEDPEGGSIPLCHGVVVGTSSPRRAIAVRSLRPDLDIRDLRGNVPTRVDKVRRGDYAGVILAAAGLDRLGLDLGGLRRIALPGDRFVQAPGQGALGGQCRRDDARIQTLLDSIHDPVSARCAHAERAVLRGLGGGCSMPLGVRVRAERDGTFHLRAALYGRSGRPARGVCHDGAGTDLDGLGATAVDALMPLVSEPLRGRTVLVVRPSGGDSRLAAPLAVAGATVETVAVTEVLPVQVTASEVRSALGDDSVLAFTSARAVDRLVEEAAYAEIDLRGRTAFAGGPATADAARAFGLDVLAPAGDDAGGHALADLLAAKGLPTSARICFPCAAQRHPDFEARAAELGFVVRALPVYRVEPLDGLEWPVDRCDALVVTSPSSADAMVRLGTPEHRALVAIGTTTGAALQSHGLPHGVASAPTPESVFEAVAARLPAEPDEPAS